MTAKKIAPVLATKAAPVKKTAGTAKAVDSTGQTAKLGAKAVEAALKAKPGRKPKIDEVSNDKPKKLEENDVDLSDLEADLEGEPEVETAAADDSKAKAKPLRMKVSRAKERALMREFGLE